MKRAKAIKEAVAYTRVSTDGQGERDVGLQGQRAAINYFATQSGFEIVSWFSDVSSGRGKDNLVDRPQANEAIEVAAARGIPIIVSGLDRLSRDTETLERIVRERGISVVSATEGTINAVTLGSLAARAQTEGDLIARRTKEALAVLKQQGVRLGNPINLPEAQKKGAASNRDRGTKKVQEIAAALEAHPDWEKLTVAETVDLLNAEGILTSRRERWTVAALRRPLKQAKESLEKRRVAPYERNPNFGRF